LLTVDWFSVDWDAYAHWLTIVCNSSGVVGSNQGQSGHFNDSENPYYPMIKGSPWFMVDSKSLMPWMRICLSIGSVNQGFTSARDVMAASTPMRPREETPVDLSDIRSNNVETHDMSSQINSNCHNLACIVRVICCHGRSTRASSSLHLVCIRQVSDIWIYIGSHPACSSVLCSICAPKVHAMECCHQRSIYTTTENNLPRRCLSENPRLILKVLGCISRPRICPDFCPIIISINRGMSENELKRS